MSKYTPFEEEDIDVHGHANEYYDVEATCQMILAQEDTSGNCQVTIEDSGPKVITVGTLGSDGYLGHDIRGTYQLSNLLQELTLAQDYGRKHIVLDETRLNENPVSRLKRMIRLHFWDGLTRRIDAQGLELICRDPKNRSKNQTPVIYIPYEDELAFRYFTQVSEQKPHLKLEVVKLPEKITPQFVKSINHKPGILSLKLQLINPNDISTDFTKDNDLINKYQGTPFVVPGGRFNEMYGWDSYFETLGLIIDGKVELGKAMVENFIYSINHYGKILNANRSYYLTRSQPPFLSDMALKVYHALEDEDEPNEEGNIKWLRGAFRAVIKEYYTVWCIEPRLCKNGLSRYYCEGIGMPPETEATHFVNIMTPYAKEKGISVEEYMEKYDDGTYKCPELDSYFIHDRAVRESGHDTTYRLEKKCADLCTVDLNCLLYKYEIDIADTIKNIFHDKLVLIQNCEDEEFLKWDNMPEFETSASWYERAHKRKETMEKLMWNEEKCMYFDYNHVEEQQETYEAVTAIMPLWCEMVDQIRAEQVADVIMKKFEVTGGLVCGTEESRGKVGLKKMNRQWDYPFGWAPHQILAWQSFVNYDLANLASRSAYRWLFTIIKSFVDYNGVVPEKFDIVGMTHQVKVEYGNVGLDFRGVPREGFGWMNASFQCGLKYLNTHMIRALGALTVPDVLFPHLDKNIKRPSGQNSQDSVPSAAQLVKVFQELNDPNNSIRSFGSKSSDRRFIRVNDGDVTCFDEPPSPMIGPTSTFKQ